MPNIETNCPDSAEGTDCVDFDRDEGLQDDRLVRNNLKDETSRLRTFVDWPISMPVKPCDLAREGFYYLNTGDKVKCIFCNLILKSWEPGDEVRREHAKFNPNCPFLLGTNVGNVPVVEGRKSPPSYPEYSKYEARLGSFSSMQKSIEQTPEQLAEAGFFYTGTADDMICFHCGLNLRNWDPEDEPWAEHRHWFPDCEFLKTQPQPEEDSFLMTPVIKKCINMGYDRNLVKNAVSRKRRSQAEEFEDINALVDAVEKLRIQQESSKRIHERGTSMKKRKENAAASGPSSGASAPSGASSMEDEYLQMKEQRLCKICMEAEVEVVFVPCGHFVCCENCAHKLRECPICRHKIRTIVRTYLA